MEGNNIFKSKLVWIMVAVAVISVAVIVALMAASNATDDMKETPSGDIVDLDETTDDRDTTSDRNTTDEKDTTNRREEETSTDDRGYVGEEGVNGDRETDKNIIDDAKEDASDIGEDIKDGAEDIKDGASDVIDDVKDRLEAGVTPVGELFANTKELQWPVMGNIILDYSMDKTVYFPTLDVYKVNDGIMIQSEVGTKVVAAAAGQISEIGFNEEIGNYIVVDMGEGYAATYGQLDNITLKEGNSISKGEKIGTVAEPTKYYSVEGCNVYFKLSKDNKPIDPVEYFAY